MIRIKIPEKPDVWRPETGRRVRVENCLFSDVIVVLASGSTEAISGVPILPAGRWRSQLAGKCVPTSEVGRGLPVRNRDPISRLANRYASLRKNEKEERFRSHREIHRLSGHPAARVPRDTGARNHTIFARANASSCAASGKGKTPAARNFSMLTRFHIPHAVSHPPHVTNGPCAAP